MENGILIYQIKKNGRILKRTSKKDIEDVVISFWNQEEENPTVDMIFHEWIDSKLTREKYQSQQKDRYERQYEQCFLKFGKNEIKVLVGI